MNIQDILSAILDDLGRDDHAAHGMEVKKDIGTVGEDLIAAFEDLEEMKEQLHDSMEYRVREIERQLRREFKQKHMAILKKSEDLWDQVYNELDIIERDKNYVINRKSGVVSQKMRVPSCFKGDLKDLL